MLRSVEVSGKSLEEALERAARYFDVLPESLSYEVISEGRGFLSAFTPRVIKVRVWIEEAPQERAPGKEKAPGKEAKETSEEVCSSPVSLLRAEEELGRFFKELMDKMQMEVDFQVQEKDGFLSLFVEGKDAGMLIGKRGETLEALETLLRIVMSKKGFSNVGLQLDISGYRERREEALRRLAEKSAKKVIKEKRRLKLEPMNARERRIIHTSLKDYPEVTTYSVGEGTGRRVVVDLKKEKSSNRSGGNKRPVGK